MAANVERMMFVGETPWHGLGKMVSEDISIADAFVESGANFEVGLKPLYTVKAGDGASLLPDFEVDHKAIFRKDTGKVLGIAGPRWTPMQNVHAFDWFKPFLDSGEVKLHTAGVLDEGRRVWVLAQIQRANSEIVKGDEVCKFILLSNPHIFGKAVMVGFTPVRVVCVNTLAAAIGSAASKLLRVRHTAQAQVNLENIRDTVNAIDAKFEATADQYRLLARKGINQADVKKYVKIVLGVEETPDDKLATRTKNTIESIMKNFEMGLGSNVPGVRGTLWGAYNAYNEYLNYQQGRSRDNRLDNLWFGSNVKDNEFALETALAMV